MLKDKILQYYKSILYKRFDGEIAYYFGLKDFLNLKAIAYEFKSSKDITLRGNFYYYDNYKDDHIIVFDHGMGAGHNSYFREIELIASKGYMVYSYDHTGCMGSDGEHSNGFLTSLADLDYCLKAIKKDYPNHKISVIGHSWGGFSTSNIASFHPDIAHVISLAPFISLDAMLRQTFAGLLSFMRKDIMAFDSSFYPEYAHSSAIKALENYNGYALIIHSKDDDVLNIKYHFNKLKKALQQRQNIEFIMVDKKRHNPHYSLNAIKLLKEYKKELRLLSKKGLIKNKEEQEKLIQKYDWLSMTEQDEDIWNKIFEVLEK